MLRTRTFGASVMAIAIIGLCGSRLLAADVPEFKPPERPARGALMQRGGGVLDLLEAKVVAGDLKLTDEQNDSIKKLSDDSRAKMREAFSNFRSASKEERADMMKKMADAQKEIEKKIDGILDAKQQARFKEIKLQMVGAFALSEDSVQDALKLNEDQESSIGKIEKKYREDREAAMKDAGGDRTAARDKMREIMNDAKEKMLAVLTSDQHDQFEKMQGKKLDLSSVRFGSRGGFGRRQRNADSDNSENKSDNKSDTKSDNKSDSK